MLGASQLNMLWSIANFKAIWSIAKVNDYTCKYKFVEIDVPTNFVSLFIRDVKILGQFFKSSI